MEINMDKACAHFGYDPELLRKEASALWPRDELLEKVASLVDFIKFEELDKKKFRIVIDHDPEYPRVLAQAWFQSKFAIGTADREEP